MIKIEDDFMSYHLKRLIIDEFTNIKNLSVSMCCGVITIKYDNMDEIKISKVQDLITYIRTLRDF